MIYPQVGILSSLMMLCGLEGVQFSVAVAGLDITGS